MSEKELKSVSNVRGDHYSRSATTRKSEGDHGEMNRSIDRRDAHEFPSAIRRERFPDHEQEADGCDTVKQAGRSKKKEQERRVKIRPSFVAVPTITSRLHRRNPKCDISS